jgi:hypothetical protein
MADSELEIETDPTSMDWPAINLNEDGLHDDAEAIAMHAKSKTIAWEKLFMKIGAQRYLIWALHETGRPHFGAAKGEKKSSACVVKNSSIPRREEKTVEVNKKNLRV